MRTAYQIGFAVIEQLGAAERLCAERFAEQRADALRRLLGRQNEQLFKRNRAADAHAQSVIPRGERAPFQQENEEQNEQKQCAARNQAADAAVPEIKEVKDAQHKEKQTQSQSVQRGRNVVFAVKRRCHAENLRIKEKDGLRFRAFLKLYAVSSFRSGGNLI